jgi:integrase
MPDLKHLKRRGSTWFVRVRTPAALVDKFGHEVVRATGTADLREAQELRHGIIAKIKADFRAGKSGAFGLRAMIEDEQKQLIEHARALRALVALHPERDDNGVTAADMLDHSVAQVLDAIPGPRDDAGYPVNLPAETERTIRTAYRVAQGEDVDMLGEQIEKYLAEIGTGAEAVTQQTLRIKRRILQAFMERAGNIELREITKRTHATPYLEDVLLKSELSVKTVKDTLAHLSAFFAWAEARHKVDANPFRMLSKTVRKSTRGTSGDKREPWQESELLSLFTKIDRNDNDFELNAGGRARRVPDAVVWNMAAIAAYTGMRVNEIASTQIKDVHADRIHVPEGKTESSVRDVPLHPAIRELVKKLVKSSTDGYLVPHLTPGGPDAKRSWNFVKKFSRARRTAGVTRKRADFHALRHSMTTAMQRAGVPREVREQITGHAEDTGAHAVYSHGQDFKTLLAAVSKVSYGKKVDALIRAVK